MKALFAETLRLFRANPLGMVGVALTRLFAGREAAQERLTRIVKDKP